MCIIKERKNVYYNDIHTLCRNDPEMWSEIKRLVPSKNKHTHITRDISANDFNHHFANISNKINSKFQILMTIVSRKAQKVFIVFVSMRCLMKILKHIQ